MGPSLRAHAIAQRPQITGIMFASRLVKGRIAIVTNVEAGCGGREMSQRLVCADERCCRGRSSRGVLTPDAGVKSARSLKEACEAPETSGIPHAMVGTAAP
jgi:hypothetical protein